jgi:ligand-binding SRPBCC domain-containing protein
MKMNHFNNAVSIAAPIEQVFTFLAEPRHLVDLHPLIVGVKELPAEAAHTRKVEIRDKIKLFGLWPIYKTYEALITVQEPNRSLLLETFTSPGIHVRNTITMKPEHGRTIVEEQVLVETPGYLTRFVMKQIRTSHDQMLVQLKQQLER